jgi:hypothetical protein
MNRLLFVLLSLVLSSAAVSAEMYRWVDSQGRVHYSDEPPPAGAKSSKTVTPPPPSYSPSGEAAKPKTWQEKDVEFRQRQSTQAEAQAKKEKEEADAKQKKQNCEIARKQLQTIESGQRISDINEKGEREYLDDAARQKALEDARRTVDTWCK